MKVNLKFKIRDFEPSLFEIPVTLERLCQTYWEDNWGNYWILNMIKRKEMHSWPHTVTILQKMISNRLHISTKNVRIFKPQKMWSFDVEN